MNRPRGNMVLSSLFLLILFPGSSDLIQIPDKTEASFVHLFFREFSEILHRDEQGGPLVGKDIGLVAESLENDSLFQAVQRYFSTIYIFLV